MEVLDRRLILLLREAGNTTQEVSAGEDRVTLKSQRGISLSSGVVIEVDLRHSPIEVRLGHPGAQADDLVEVPHRDDIVIEVDRIASD